MKGLNNKVKIAVASFVMPALFVVLGAAPAYAVTISPLTFDVTADPGQVITNFIDVLNNERNPLSFKVESEDFAAVGESGGVAIDKNVPPELSAKSWIKFVPETFTIEPGHSQPVQFTINVPLNADPGGKYTSILVSSVPGVGGGGPSISQKVASLLLIKVTGKVEEKLKVAEFKAPDFLENGPVNLTLRLQNDGTVHLRPAGFVFINDWRGNEATKLNIPQERIIPRTVRALDLTWDKKWLFGKYTANLAGIYGSGNDPLSASVEFWVVPWKILGSVSLAVLVVLGFFFAIRRRLSLAMRILFTGK